MWREKEANENPGTRHVREDVILEVDPSHPNPGHPIYVRGEPLRRALLKT